ncbi:hypothetical protein C8Q76DRAFT_800976 [Earliella scabrosa]|nr:hypothetical protein C8Q76DRAFT_800976 [Earliella scabrosa]
MVRPSATTHNPPIRHRCPFTRQEPVLSSLPAYDGETVERLWALQLPLSSSRPRGNVAITSLDDGAHVAGTHDGGATTPPGDLAVRTHGFPVPIQDGTTATVWFDDEERMMISDRNTTRDSPESGLSSAMSLLGLEDHGRRDDREGAVQVNRMGREALPRPRDRHVMRVTIHATNVTVYNGAAPPMPPAHGQRPVGAHRGVQTPQLHAIHLSPVVSTPTTPTNTPRRGNALGVELPQPGRVGTPMANDHPLPHDAAGSPALGLADDGPEEHSDDDTTEAPPAYPGNRLPWNPNRQYFAPWDPLHRGKWYVVTAGVRVGIWKAWVDMAHYVNHEDGGG